MSRPILRDLTVPGLRPAGNRARLILRVYEVDPLLCPCGKRMRVAGFITQAPVIRKILDHRGPYWEQVHKICLMGDPSDGRNFGSEADGKDTWIPFSFSTCSRM